MPGGVPVGPGIHGRGAAALLVILALCFASHASAAPQDTTSAVIVLIAAPHDLTCERIGAELSTLGYEIKTIEDRRADSTAVGSAEIELLSRTVDAAATINVDLGAGDIRVWTMDRASGRMVLRVVVSLEGEPAVAAMRAVEALRTLLNRPEPRAAFVTPVLPPPSGPPPGPDVTPNGVVSRSTVEAAPVVGLSIGPALAVNRGSFGASWQGLIGLRWLFRERVGLEILGVLPITGGKWQETEGSATLTLSMAGAGLHVRPLAIRWCILDMGAGLGAAWLHAESSPGPGFAGRTNDTVVASPFARLGYAVPLARVIWLRADVATVFTLPRPAFTVAERTLGSGSPTAIASIGLEVALR